MKFRHACAVGLALSVLGGTASMAQDMSSGTYGPYLRGEGGWNHLQDMSFHGSSTALAGSSSFDEGYILGGALGYGFGQYRLELGLDYRHNDVDNLHIGNTGAFPAAVAGSHSGGGSATSVVGMFNGYMDLPWRTSMMPQIVPYIGAGVGVASVNFNSVKSGSTTIIDDSDAMPAIQAMAGLRYQINDKWGVGLEYRFLNGFHPNLKDATGNRMSTNDYRNHSILLSVTYTFGVAPPPAPTPAAAAAPAPMAAPAPVAKQVFIVFFDFDKSTLTPAGMQVVDAAATAYKSDQTVHIDLTGYTDLAGTQKYNLGLSKRRAETVTSYLAKQGIPASAIAVAWRGKENPRVPTPDGVREPQNRRVEIDFR
jgi:outer membrane protein OmpA-like peptidoglycan-associated protein